MRSSRKWQNYSPTITHIDYIGGIDVLPVKDPRKYKLNYALARNFIKDKSRVI